MKIPFLTIKGVISKVFAAGKSEVVTSCSEVKPEWTNRAEVVLSAMKFCSSIARKYDIKELRVVQRCTALNYF